MNEYPVHRVDSVNKLRLLPRNVWNRAELPS